MIVELVERMLQGDVRALARLITYVENRHPDMPAVMERIYGQTGRAFIIGITGPPGAGKSTLVDQLTAGFRRQGKRVGVVAIDPSSPFSGGALLGDRVRMMQHAADPDVFIRSLGSRGSHGGLSLATREVVYLLDAAGYETIIVETVGVGQTELDIMELAHSVVVVFVPESGDTVQTMKAGLTEIADIFVVNKADRDGAERMNRELSQMIELAYTTGWKPPVLLTQAFRGAGLEELLAALTQHHAYGLEHGLHQDRRSSAGLTEFMEIIVGELRDRIRDGSAKQELGELIEKIKQGKINPYGAALLVLQSPTCLTELFERKP